MPPMIYNDSDSWTTLNTFQSLPIDNNTSKFLYVNFFRLFEFCIWFLEFYIETYRLVSFRKKKKNHITDINHVLIWHLAVCYAPIFCSFNCINALLTCTVERNMYYSASVEYRDSYFQEAGNCAQTRQYTFNSHHCLVLLHPHQSYHITVLIRH